MRNAALLALLPLLVKGLATRKSLSFGPSHSHATFETFQHAPVEFVSLSSSSPRDVAGRWLDAKLGFTDGEDYYIRDDVGVSERASLMRRPIRTTALA